MLYVSFYEIFSIKAIDAFKETQNDNEANRSATICFFAGIIMTLLLDKFVHYLNDMNSGRQKNIPPECDNDEHRHPISHDGEQPGKCCQPIHITSDGDLSKGSTIIYTKPMVNPKEDKIQL